MLWHNIQRNLLSEQSWWHFMFCAPTKARKTLVSISESQPNPRLMAEKDNCCAQFGQKPYIHFVFRWQIPWKNGSSDTSCPSAKTNFSLIMEVGAWRSRNCMPPKTSTYMTLGTTGLLNLQELWDYMMTKWVFGLHDPYVTLGTKRLQTENQGFRNKHSCLASDHCQQEMITACLDKLGTLQLTNNNIANTNLFLVHKYTW